ncbi:trifunctional serine/threonine-protein kinase/ATP-binding protein/sensor histidine kinase [Pantoea trifolii]|uniref:histidine kinase n=1 Tax=Pantoea trifolii TaxID=2968030 RepID=A0ABT1VIU9_9GAMM|nr:MULTISPECIES: ATP-binding sensor histidine kinase [unclassified Pantoea]MCQ8227444.1 AAA family ATPase [Pantoea sp. MMK2]MCQ8235616.1 AAA family ATPase [Pantoea sp. MMK3]
MSTLFLSLNIADDAALVLADDMVFTPLAQEGQVEWIECRHLISGECFVLATAAAEEAVFPVTQLLKNEYALRTLLAESWALKPLRHTLYHGRYALIYPAFHYQTLTDYLRLPAGKIQKFISCAVSLCDALSKLHQQGLVHGDIKPANFFFTDQGDVVLGGFGLAFMEADSQQPLRAAVTGGTLAYMSPEHTSRTAHAVSRVSDLYSLGIVLYELLTGRLPYGSAEGGAAEWVHHHIASEALPPHRLRKDVPLVLSSIILRLLTKSPEQRYQTVEGVLADLRRCESNLMPDGLVESFALGLQDVPTSTLSSDVLYSDHAQASEMLAAFDEVSSSGKHCMVAISGAPGSGKSSLIASALKILREKNALLTVTKADQHSPILPYAVFTSAFRSLTLHLLGLPAAEMARWKTHITRQLGHYVGLAVNLVPELGILLNHKASVQADARSLDARNRMNLVACSLVKAFTVPGRPLILLIDDVHWADQATLQLLQNLLRSSDDIPLLLVISHRDHASLPCPTVVASLDRIRAAATRIVDVTPEPLSVKNIASWLAGIFHTRSAETAELAQIIHEKTAGNPLATREFYRQAVRDHHITHVASHKWTFNPHALKNSHYTANVAAGVLQQLQLLALPVRQLLGRLACIGSRGDLPVLAAILNTAVSAIHATLRPAAEARLISLSDHSYAFMHDSMHEAALKLLSSAAKDDVHFAAVRYYMQAVRENNAHALLFSAAHHTITLQNRALLMPEAATFGLLLLNATRRAKIMGDYASALRFLHTARALNAESGVEEGGVILFEQAECEFLSGNLSGALALSSEILATPGAVTDKAEAATLIAEIHMRQSDSQLALETALAWLAVFGIHLNRYPDKAECDAARQRLKKAVGKNPYTRFRSLPRLTCHKTEAVMNLMASASTFAAFISPRLQFIILCKLLHLTMEKGISGASTLALAWYGVVCGDQFNEYSRGFASALLARELVYKHDFVSYKARTLMPLDQVSVWTMPLSYAIECAKATFDVAVDIGDRTSACLALRHLTMNCLARGDHLDGVHTSIMRGMVYVRKAQYRDVEVILGMQLDYVMFLRKPAGEILTGDDFRAPTLNGVLPEHAIEPLYLMQFWARLYKGMAHFFAGEHAAAHRQFIDAAPLTDVIPGHVHMLDFHLYSALSLSIPLQPNELDATQRLQLQRHLERIMTWSAENPGTFADKEALLRAELLRLEDNSGAALEQFEKAIELSRKGQFHPINGLACELAARCANARGMAFAAEGYIKGALAAWDRWGAGAKVRQLEMHYPHLAAQPLQTALNTVTFEQSAAISDLQSMVTAMRALTEEINLDRLIHILMMMLVERAGAQHCILIRLIDGNVPEIQARASSTVEGVRVKIVNQLPVATDLPLSILSAVIRTGQEIRTGRPEVFSPFSQDNYLVASGAAVMCVPMFRQAQMVGVLYLENRLMPDVFTAEHSRIVSMLGAQAAVSLETARLYAELVEENIQRRKIEKQLRASQTSLMLGEKISHTGTWHWHLGPDIQLISDEYKRIMGLPAGQVNTSMAEFQRRVHPDDLQCLKALIESSVAQGVSMQAEFRIIRDDGECRYIKGIGEPVENWPEVAEYFGTLTDITAQRQSEDAARIAQAELARVARATTVGQLTSSIAHEINQPLMSIVANAGASLRWLKREPAQLDKASESIEEIINEGQRAGEIIRGLQSLTRNNVAEYGSARLHLLARDILSLSRLELERRFVALELDIKAQWDEVFCERVQIQQVLLNLVINAIEAMADNTGARILRLSSSNPDANRIRIEVADNGTGLSAEVIGKIFDSFYTTKAEGMGMGLTISNEIIKRHGGVLSAENRPQGGSLFSFTLPLNANK